MSQPNTSRLPHGVRARALRRPGDGISGALVTERMVADAVTCGDDPGEHLATLEPFVEARFAEVYVGQIGPEYRGFFDFYGRQVLPRLLA